MNTNKNTAQPIQGAAKRFMLLLVLSLSSLLAAITVDMVNPVLGLIGESLSATKAQVSWVVSGVALVLAIGVPLYGRMSDFFELRKLFMLAASVLTLGSLICALSASLPLLVLGRMIQGAGMAAIPVLSVVAISKLFSEGNRGSVLGIVAGCIGIGTAFGPIFGGIVGQIWGWPALFWITFVLSLLIVAGAAFALPAIEPVMEAGETRQFDLAGGGLLGLAVGLLLFGVTQGEVSGFHSLSAAASLLAAGLALVGLIWRLRTASMPFIPPSLFKNVSYISSITIAFFSMFAYFAVLVFVPMLMVEVNGLSPAQAGLTLLPGGAAVALLSPWVGRLSDQIGNKPLIVAGLVVMALSTLYLSTFAAGAAPILVSVGVLGAGIAFALIHSPANNAAVGSLQQEQLGAGMGLFQGTLYLGAGTGAGLIGALLHARKDADTAFNPLYHLHAVGYSDALLAASLAALIALIASFGLRSGSLRIKR